MVRASIRGTIMSKSWRDALPVVQTHEDRRQRKQKSRATASSDWSAEQALGTGTKKAAQKHGARVAGQWFDTLKTERTRKGRTVSQRYTLRRNNATKTWLAIHHALRVWALLRLGGVVNWRDLGARRLARVLTRLRV